MSEKQIPQAVENLESGNRSKEPLERTELLRRQMLYPPKLRARVFECSAVNARIRRRLPQTVTLRSNSFRDSSALLRPLFIGGERRSTLAYKPSFPSSRSFSRAVYMPMSVPALAGAFTCGPDQFDSLQHAGTARIGATGPD